MTAPEFRLVDSVTDAFCEVVAAAAASGPAPLFLAGGGTAEQCYRQLATVADLDWTGVDLFLGDERCVPQDDPSSNFGMVRRTLLARGATPRSVHPPFTAGPPADAAERYGALVRSLHTLGLVHLGLGPDGHTASLFPGADSLACSDPATPVVATEDPSGRNPLPRLTLTLPALARADLVVFTVSGSAKHEALAGVLGGSDLPAARVVAPRILWLIDAEAAGSLDLSA